VEATGNFHHEVATTAAVKANTVLDTTQPFDPAHRVLYSHPPSGVGRVCRLLLVGQAATTRLLEWLLHLDALNREGQKAEVLEQDTAFCSSVVGKVGDAFVSHSALLRPAEEENSQKRVHEKEVFDRVEPLLTAVVSALVLVVDRARDRPLGAVVGKRGEAPSPVVCSCGSVSSSCSRRLSRSAKLRTGASLVARSAARRAASRLWSHVFVLPCDIP
jgi:hypothetical protein